MPLLTYDFEIEGEPFPKERPRTFSQHGRIFTRTPDRTAAAQAHIQASYIANLGAPPLEGDLKVRLVFHRTGKRRADLDNLAKLVTDALNGLAYKDDSQIVALEARVVYESLAPKTWIELSQLPATL